MTLPRFEEPHPPTPLSASREGGVFLLVAICRERGVFLLLSTSTPSRQLCGICSEGFSAKAPTTNYAYPSFLGWQTTSTDKGVFLPLLACGEGLGVGFSAAGIYKENLQ